MGYRLKPVLVLLLLAATSVAADDRLAVLEFFGRPTGAYCSAAGPAMTSLQSEMQGRAVLLEYDYDLFRGDREDRFWSAGGSAPYLPLVIVGSGYLTSSGEVDYENVYRGMINAELGRPPRAAVSAYWRRVSDAMRAYVVIRNSDAGFLEVEKEAAVWLIAYEQAPIGVSTTWVRATKKKFLPFDVGPSETATITLTTPPMSGVDWSRMAVLVLVEDRPGGIAAYDTVQAVEPIPADLTVAPEHLVVSPQSPVAELELSGPHLLSWSASSDVDWIEVEPDSGDLPASVTVTLRSDLRPPGASEATVTFAASGGGMSFSETIEVGVDGLVRQAGGRVAAER